MAGGAEFPVHLEMFCQVLPTVAGADISNRAPYKSSAASHDQMHILAHGVEQLVAANLGAPTGIVRTLTRQVRSQQRIESKFSTQRLIEYFELRMHEHHRAMRIGQDMLDQAVAPVGFRIGEAIENTIPLRVFYPVIQVALFLVAKRFPVADEKLKIPRVRLVHGRVVDFVDDAVTEGEPDPAARVIGDRKSFFGTGSPAGLDSGCAEGD